MPQNDIGSPLVCKNDDSYVLQGVVTGYNPDCTPTLFTNIPYFMPWINRNLGSKFCSGFHKSRQPNQIKSAKIDIKF